MEGLPRPGYLEDDEKHDRLAALGVGTGQWATGNGHCPLDIAIAMHCSVRGQEGEKTVSLFARSSLDNKKAK